MANLEYIQYVAQKPELHDGGVTWSRDCCIAPVQGLPQIFWETGESWGEANLWALQRTHDVKPKTVLSSMERLLKYANWLEETGTDWWEFPAKTYKRCVYRFRGHLVAERDSGRMAGSTASGTMSAVIAFYRFVKHQNLLLHQCDFFQEKNISVRVSNRFGLDRSISVATTDLSISHRKTAGVHELEDGVMPVSSAVQFDVLRHFEKVGSPDVLLMLELGFFTGMRIGTICDLKEETILNASEALIPGFHNLHVGPEAKPPVATKASGNSSSPSGHILIPNWLLEKMNEYLWSDRRIRRKKKADDGRHELVFLTKYGGSYINSKGRTGAVTEAIYEARQAAEVEGFSFMRDFHFHRTRATFATNLMMAALDAFPEKGSAIKFVRDACLHKDEKVTLGYVTFIEESEALSAAGEKFEKLFMGW